MAKKSTLWFSSAIFTDGLMDKIDKCSKDEWKQIENASLFEKISRIKENLASFIEGHRDMEFGGLYESNGETTYYAKLFMDSKDKDMFLNMCPYYIELQLGMSPLHNKPKANTYHSIDMDERYEELKAKCV